MRGFAVLACLRRLLDFTLGGLSTLSPPWLQLPGRDAPYRGSDLRSHVSFREDTPKRITVLAFRLPGDPVSHVYFLLIHGTTMSGVWTILPSTLTGELMVTSQSASPLGGTWISYLRSAGRAQHKLAPAEPLSRSTCRVSVWRGPSWVAPSVACLGLALEAT
jgi:hypothetical protein